MDKLSNKAFTHHAMSIITTYTKDLKPVNGCVAIYARLAFDENNELIKQADSLIERAEAIGDSSYCVYYDCGSGFDEKRAEFLRLLADVKSGKYERLYIRDIRCLTRNPSLLYNITDEISSLGVEIVVMQK